MLSSARRFRFITSCVGDDVDETRLATACRQSSSMVIFRVLWIKLWWLFITFSLSFRMKQRLPFEEWSNAHQPSAAESIASASTRPFSELTPLRMMMSKDLRWWTLSLIFSLVVTHPIIYVSAKSMFSDFSDLIVLSAKVGLAWIHVSQGRSISILDNKHVNLILSSAHVRWNLKQILTVWTDWIVVGWQ